MPTREVLLERYRQTAAAVSAELRRHPKVLLIERGAVTYDFLNHLQGRVPALPEIEAVILTRIDNAGDVSSRCLQLRDEDG